MSGISRLLFGHPLVKAMGLGLFGILGNVLAGAYVFDIARTDSKGSQFLDWAYTPHSRSFWCLAGVVVLVGLYGWGMARFDAGVRKALTAADIRQRALEELLPPLLERAKLDIAAGKLTSLEEVMRMFETETRRPD